MDVLRNLFGNLTSGIIRLLVTVGIIAAVGYFIVRPALDTTNKAIDSANKSWERSFGGKGTNVTDVSKTIEDANRQVQRQIRRSLHAAKVEGSPRRLIKCVEHARGDVVKIQRCTVKF